MQKQRLFRLRPTPTNHPLVLASQDVRLGGPVPRSADLTQWFPGVEDQEREGSCTGFMAAEWIEVRYGVLAGRQITAPGGPGRRSPGYGYARERQRMGTFPQDSGGSIGEMFSIMQDDGVCSLALMPYDANPSTLPPPGADADAANFRLKAKPYSMPISKDAVLLSLGAGVPVGFATAVYPSFQQDTDAQGNIPMPGLSEQLEGYHALCAMGADDYGVFGPNHWGRSWGDNGWWRMTWAFVATQWIECWNAG